ADPGVLRVALRAAGEHRAAPSAVLRLDPQPDRAGSVLHPAGAQRDPDDPHAVAHADADDGSDAGEDDEGDAVRVLGDARVRAGGSRALLDGQRLVVAAAAVGDHEAHAGDGNRRRTLTSVRADADTIAAVATAPGAGGVGILRISG